MSLLSIYPSDSKNKSYKFLVKSNDSMFDQVCRKNYEQAHYEISVTTHYKIEYIFILYPFSIIVASTFSYKLGQTLHCLT